MMNADSLMMTIILGGIALCGVYFRAQFMNWRKQHTAEKKNEIQGRLLHALPPQERTVVPANDDTSHRQHRNHDR